jgi:hypothetical protein
VNQEHVGVAAGADSERLPGSDRDDAVMPLAAVKIGRMWPNNPESWVEVVELSVMNRSSACAEPTARMATRKVMERIMINTFGPAGIVTTADRETAPS